MKNFIMQTDILTRFIFAIIMMFMMVSSFNAQCGGYSQYECEAFYGNFVRKMLNPGNNLIVFIHYF